MALRGFHELQVHRADGAAVLLQNGLHGPAALVEVALDAAHQPDVVRGVDVELDVHPLAQRGLRQDQDALHQDHRPGVEVLGLRTPAVRLEVVRRLLDGAPGQERVEVLHHQAGLEGVRVVEVEPRAALGRQVREVAVVRVVVEERDPARAEPLHHLALDGRLAGPGASREADDDGHRIEEGERRTARKIAPRAGAVWTACT